MEKSVGVKQKRKRKTKELKLRINWTSEELPKNYKWLIVHTDYAPKGVDLSKLSDEKTVSLEELISKEALKGARERFERAMEKFDLLAQGRDLKELSCEEFMNLLAKAYSEVYEEENRGIE